jgi:hypothetical protein
MRVLARVVRMADDFDDLQSFLVRHLAVFRLSAPVVLSDHGEYRGVSRTQREKKRYKK